MISNRLRHWLQHNSRFARFSLRSLLVLLTFASVAFAIWWQWPRQIDRVPQELGRVPDKSYECITSLWQIALWTEAAPRDKKPAGQDPFEGDPRGGPIYAATGKCWARRNGWSSWQLDGPAEVFTKAGDRVIRAEYAAGKLHGEFRSWFTSGQLREVGQYERGEKVGEWQLFEQFGGKVRSHEVYDRGQKAGVWKNSRGLETYRNGKLVLRETQDAYNREWTVQEFDAGEELQRTTYWNPERTEQIGVDHFLAGRRHGLWYRCKFENQRPLFARGEWQNGRPVGEWVYEREAGPPRRFLFERGELLAIDNEPVEDLLVKRVIGLEDEESLIAKFVAAEDHDLGVFDRCNFLQMVCGYDWPSIYVDPQLICTQAEFDALWEEMLPENFVYENLPATAAIMLALRDTNLAFDYRLGALWITTPRLAAQWRDETACQPWFGKIANTPWVHQEIDHVTHTIDSPYQQRELYFGSDYESRTEWEENRQLEFRQPLTGSLGTALRADGRYEPKRPLLQLPRHRFNNRPHEFSFDELLAVECEVRHCRVVLRGETLVMEPR